MSDPVRNSDHAVVYMPNINSILMICFVHCDAVFCCVGALAITGSLHRIDKDLLGWWLCERQVKAGGLNGRPEKLPDVGVALYFTILLLFSEK